eukprot:84104-Chlamydomonas_euryale.AAC.1
MSSSTTAGAPGLARSAAAPRVPGTAVLHVPGAGPEPSRACNTAPRVAATGSGSCRRPSRMAPSPSPSSPGSSVGRAAA